MRREDEGTLQRKDTEQKLRGGGEEDGRIGMKERMKDKERRRRTKGGRREDYE